MHRGTWLYRPVALAMLVMATAMCTDYDPTGPTVHTADRAVDELDPREINGDTEEWTSPTTFRDRERMRETARRMVGPPLRGDDPLEDVGPDNAASREHSRIR